MLSLIRPALVSMALFTLVLGIAYPMAITGAGQLAFPAQANGSLIEHDGKVVGSALIGQGFTSPGYLHPRPSAAGKGYDASASSGSNLGPMNADLAARIKADAAALKAEAPGQVIPADAVTTSASGLDPDISPEFALLQAPRLAAARRAPLAEVRSLIAAHVEGRLLGFIGQPRVNVLQTNLALDARWPEAQRPAA